MLLDTYLGEERTDLAWNMCKWCPELEFAVLTLRSCCLIHVTLLVSFEAGRESCHSAGSQMDFGPEHLEAGRLCTPFMAGALQAWYPAEYVCNSFWT